MECPWEIAIFASYRTLNDEQCIKYLTRLLENLQGYVFEAPDLVVPDLPPRMPNQDHNQGPNQDRNQGPNQARNHGRENNRFNNLAEDDEVNEPHGRRRPRQRDPHINAAGALGRSVKSALELFVQVNTTLAEVKCRKGNALADERSWLNCAEFFEQACNQLDAIQEYADVAYAELIGREEAVSDAERMRVASMGETVQMSRDKCYEYKGKFEYSAERRKAELERILAPQWQDRDQARARIGQDRWENNPNPSGQYARKRAAAEQELRDLKKAASTIAELVFKPRERV